MRREGRRKTLSAGERESLFAGKILPQKIAARRAEGISLSEALRQRTLA